jgi:hypothetical protein
MARRMPLHRRDEEEEPASPEVSRGLVFGFLIAALLGLVSGAVWVVWSLIRIHVLGRGL